jgi:archaeosine-15-forming tRNA-guanine transglycosylase
MSAVITKADMEPQEVERIEGRARKVLKALLGLRVDDALTVLGIAQAEVIRKGIDPQDWAYSVNEVAEALDHNLGLCACPADHHGTVN